MNLSSVLRKVGWSVLVASLLLFGGPSFAQETSRQTPPAVGQWQRVSIPSGQSKVPNTPHPLAYFLHFSPERYIDGSLCLGCKTETGQTVTIADYAVKSSQRLVGEFLGRRIIEVDLTFDIKPGSAMAQLRREWEQKEQISFESLTPVEWQSIVVQCAPNLYRELYFDSNPPSNSVPPVDARIVKIDGTPLLAVRETYPGWCAWGYWVLDRGGPWLLDFSPVQKAIARISPPNSSAPEIGCWALSIDNLEVNAPVEEDHPKGQAGGWLGRAIVNFKIENNHVVPGSSVFESSRPQ
jgi:hypothetical protein